MSLVLSSIFRDATSYIPRWVEQVTALHEQRPLSVVVGEGDSTDGTRVELAQAISDAPFDGLILHVDHGGPKFGSVDNPQRWGQIARVCNTVAARVSGQIGDDDIWCYVESDLVWTWDDMIRVVDGAQDDIAVAPLSINGRSGAFYDIWGHRGADGECFTWDPPYHPSLDTDERYVEIASAGSCFAMRGKYAHVSRFSDADCIRGIGRTLRQHGAKLMLDTHSQVVHP